MKFKISANEKEIQNVLNWIGAIGQNTRDLWDIVVPIIREKTAEEFTDDNPNRWKELSPRYLEWKRAMGYPDTIGVATGLLRDTAINTQDIFYGDRELRYQVKDSPGYFQDFHSKRPLFGYTRTHLETLYREAVQKWINNDIKEKQ